ncbi:MAG: hydroxymethylglutaryl-CoA synthase family protein [Deltaproteobacteria bacterium]|nr:hydroxymethylglutaryl-CoA synthase family protein [Deltaproteobacteria bacterium]
MAALATRQRVGIEKIWVYPCSAKLDFRKLADARNEDPDHPTKLLMMDHRGVNPCWEDPLTMAVNAAKPMLSDEDRENIELLIFGTESSPDQGKPLSTFAHRFLDLGPSVRNWETKHACYGGTAGVMTAAHWVASGVAPGKKALVVTADQSRMNLGERWEFVMGAGAAAILISNQPDILELELETNAYWTKEVGDTFRPTSTDEAGNTDESLYCYLEALDGAYAHFKEKNGFDFDARFKQHIYHVPFSAMSRRGHRAIMKRDYRMKRAALEESFERKVKPSLTFSRQLGGVYTSANFIGLVGTIAAADDLNPGDHISLYSYGSGSCSELYSAKVGPKAKEWVKQIELQQAMDARRDLTVPEYETLEKERTSYVDVATYEPKLDAVAGLYDSHYKGQDKLVLEGLKGHFRHYRWS